MHFVVNKVDTLTLNQAVHTVTTWLQRECTVGNILHLHDKKTVFFFGFLKITVVKIYILMLFT